MNLYPHWSRFLTVAALLIPLAANAASAEVVRVAKAARVAPGGPDGGLILADRQVVRVLKKSAEYIELKKYAEAVELLQKIVELPEDAFYLPDPEKKSLYRSIKTQAGRSIGSLPKPGRNAYRLRFGADASALLKLSLKEPGTLKLAEVARRYFHTPAGYEATYRLGVSRFDRGSFMAAALCFERLRNLPEVAKRWEPLLSLRTAMCWHQLGVAGEAEEILKRISREYRNADLGGETVALLPAGGDATRRLTRLFGEPTRSTTGQAGGWTTFAGNPARNPVASKDPDAAGEIWNTPTNLDHRNANPDEESTWPGNRELAELYEQQHRAVRSQKRHALPVRFPLFADGRVLFRTLGGLRAVEAETGRRRWDTLYERILWHLLPETENSPIAGADHVLGSFLRQRAFDDATFGRISSDGIRAFCVDQSGPSFTYRFADKSQGVRQPSSANQLRSFSLKTGKVEWAVGGKRDTDTEFSLGLKLPGRFFLGPPLAFGGQLYCIVEQSRQIQLLVLDAQSGAVNWSQPLVPVAAGISASPWRRLCGATPSYADGILVCPTGTGTTVAVDLLNRTLLWAFRYRVAGSPHPLPGIRPGVRPGLPAPPVNVQGWTDDLPVISGRRVLLTPRASGEVYCLNLLDGEPVWKRPREDGLYVAGVTGGHVLIVGTGNVRAWELADGATAWKKPRAIDTPTGRGVIDEHTLLLPLGKQFAIIDAATGTLKRQVQIPGSKDLGNLIIAGGRLISQSGDTVQVVHVPPEQPAKE